MYIFQATATFTSLGKLIYFFLFMDILFLFYWTMKTRFSDLALCVNAICFGEVNYLYWKTVTKKFCWNCSSRCGYHRSKWNRQEVFKSGSCTLRFTLVILVRFYGKSIIVGYLMLNPFSCIYITYRIIIFKRGGANFFLTVKWFHLFLSNRVKRKNTSISNDSV